MLADDNDLDILCEGIEDLGNRYISSGCQLSLNVEIEQVKKNFSKYIIFILFLYKFVSAYLAHVTLETLITKLTLEI